MPWQREAQGTSQVSAQKPFWEIQIGCAPPCLWHAIEIANGRHGQTKKQPTKSLATKTPNANAAKLNKPEPRMKSGAEIHAKGSPDLISIPIGHRQSYSSRRLLKKESRQHQDRQASDARLTEVGGAGASPGLKLAERARL